MKAENLEVGNKIYCRLKVGGTSDYEKPHALLIQIKKCYLNSIINVTGLFGYMTLNTQMNLYYLF